MNHRGARRRRLSLSAIAVAFCASLVSITALGCAQPLSPADLANEEHHAFPQRSSVQVFPATIIALRSLGYEVVLADPAHGKIKTAPKLLTATAHASSSSTAVATENSVAWSIDIGPMPGGAAMFAEPRGYSGGQALTPDQMNGSYLRKLFSTLYNEIDHNL